MKHLTNFGKEGYATTIGAALDDIHKWIDDFSHEKCIKNYEVVCPATAMWQDNKEIKKDLARYWGTDPVHLTPAGYEKLAEKLVEKATTNQTVKRPRTDSSRDLRKQRPRGDGTTKKAGISMSDTVTARWEMSGGQRGDGPRHTPRHMVKAAHPSKKY